MKKILSPSFAEMNSLLVLALPLMAGELVDASFNFIATILAAHLGINELAAAGLVTSLFVTIMVFVWGILISISTLISQKYGAKDDAGISRVLKDGLILACLMTLPFMALLWFMSPILLFLGQEPETVAQATSYLHALTLAVFPDFCAVVLLQFLIGLGNSRIIFLFNAIRIPITLLISYALMYGKFNLPALGLMGLGVGISIGMWVASFLLLLYIIWHPTYRQYLSSSFKNTQHYIFDMLKIGLPISGMFCIEVGFFTVMALIMGRIDSTILAANQIASQFTGFFTIVISFCISQAVSIKVGHAVGRREFDSVLRITQAGAFIAVGLMIVVGICYWIIPAYLISLDLDPTMAKNELITHYARQFLFMGGFVQIFEAVRIIYFGGLRGLGETKFSMLTSLFIFWIIAFPLGYILTFSLNMGGIGMWIGMTTGAILGAILLVWWLNKRITLGGASLNRKTP